MTKSDQIRRAHEILRLVYIGKKTRLFLQDQTATWWKWSYPIFPEVHCGWAHQSALKSRDAGRNQLGCDFSYTFH